VVDHRDTAIGVAALASAGTAAGSSSDDAFLSQLNAQGIGFSSPQDAVGDAHTVCQLLGKGQSAVSIGQDILSHTDLNTRQAALFVVDSVRTYCPQYGSQLTA
jgi:hypothetical protein